MFKRPEESYNLSKQIISNVLEDEANPLSQIVKLIPENSIILDIGAGNGLLAQLLTAANKTVIIDGIEPNVHATNIAKEHYRKLYNGYMSSFMDELAEQSYDFIILADVIEHISDPIEFINEIKSIMSDKTKLVYSIPNVAYGSIRINFLFGVFKYTDSGILEKTHLRFYTEETINDLMKHSKLNIEQVFYLRRDIFSMEKSPFLSKIKLSSLCEIMSDKYSNVYQFLVITNKSNNIRTDYINVGKQQENCYTLFLKLKIHPLLLKIKKLLKKIMHG